MSRFVVGMFITLLLPAVVFAQEAKKRKPGFTIGKDTTYIMGPVDKDGYIDYETALNEKLREGVTPENNAMVLLFKSFGPRHDGEKIPDPFFKWMQTIAPAENGEYLVDIQQFIRGHLLRDYGNIHDPFHKQFDKATQRPWTAPECPEVAGWLKVNEKPLTIVIEATKRTQFYRPLLARRKEEKFSGAFALEMFGVPSCRTTAAALSARALLRMGEKKFDAAWQDPNDLFSGKALIYRPSDTGYLLYSVGVNGKDDEGRGYDEGADDLPVRMPLAK